MTRLIPDPSKITDVTAHVELTEEERSILAFAEADLTKRGMKLALAMVTNPDTKPEDLRAVIDTYRDRWQLALHPPRRGDA